MFKKTAAFLLSAVIMAGSSTVTFAENSQVQTIVCEQQLGASSSKTWDGKAELEAGKKYVLKKSVKITGEVTIPKGTTLVINKGAKLTVSKTGKLTVNGTITAKAGSTISVSGKVAFKKTAKATLGGKFTVNKTGSVSGTPKSLKLGKSGVVTINGKSTCKKLTALVKTEDTTEQDKQVIETNLNKMVATFVGGNVSQALTYVYPEAYIQELSKSFEAYGMTMDEFFMMFVNQMLEEYGMSMADVASEIGNCSVSVTKLTDCTKDLTDEEKLVIASMLNGNADIEKAYTVDAVVCVNGVPVEGADMQIKFAKVGGSLYLFG